MAERPQRVVKLDKARVEPLDLLGAEGGHDTRPAGIELRLETRDERFRGFDLSLQLVHRLRAAEEANEPGYSPEAGVELAERARRIEDQTELAARAVVNREERELGRRQGKRSVHFGRGRWLAARLTDQDGHYAAQGDLPGRLAERDVEDVNQPFDGRIGLVFGGRLHHDPHQRLRTARAQ